MSSPRPQNTPDINSQIDTNQVEKDPKAKNISTKKVWPYETNATFPYLKYEQMKTKFDTLVETLKKEDKKSDVFELDRSQEIVWIQNVIKNLDKYVGIPSKQKISQDIKEIEAERETLANFQANNNDLKRLIAELKTLEQDSERRVVVEEKLKTLKANYEKARLEQLKDRNRDLKSVNATIKSEAWQQAESERTLFLASELWRLRDVIKEQKNTIANKSVSLLSSWWGSSKGSEEGSRVFKAVPGLIGIPPEPGQDADLETERSYKNMISAHKKIANAASERYRNIYPQNDQKTTASVLKNMFNSYKLPNPLMVDNLKKEIAEQKQKHQQADEVLMKKMAILDYEKVSQEAQRAELQEDMNKVELLSKALAEKQEELEDYLATCYQMPTHNEKQKAINHVTPRVAPPSRTASDKPRDVLTDSEYAKFKKYEQLEEDVKKNPRIFANLFPNRPTTPVEGEKVEQKLQQVPQLPSRKL